MTVEEREELTKNIILLQDIMKYIDDRIKFLNSMIDYHLESNEEQAIKYMYGKLELETIKRKIEGSTDEENS